MQFLEFVAHALDTVNEETQVSLEGMTVEQLLHRPGPASNNMAWLAWHIARTQDERASFLTGRDQLWIADRWHQRFGLPPDPEDTGRKHTDEDVAAVRPESVEVASGYCAAAYERAVGYLRSLGIGDEEMLVAHPEGGESKLIAILDRMVHGGYTHVGQLMYVRGLIEGRHWFSR
jgi:hypothetical protein